MGIFSYLFDIVFKSKEEREVEKIFEKVAHFWESDEEQNKLCSPMLIPKMKSTVNQIPNAIGEFGRDIRNPIPCNGPLGEIAYLSNLLIAETEEKIFFHRLGSSNSIDIYEIISHDGKFYDILYLDMYYQGKSNKIPKGYKYQTSFHMIRGTNHKCDKFPDQLYSQMLAQAKNSIYFMPIDRDIKNIDLDAAHETIGRYHQ